MQNRPRRGGRWSEMGVALVAVAAGAGCLDLDDIKGRASVEPSFTSSGLYPAGTQPSAVAVGDLGREGVGHDFVVVRRGTADLTLAGTHDQLSSYPVGPDPTGVAMSDLNNDGRDDVVAISALPPEVTILLSDGTGRFSSFIVEQPRIERAVALAIADMDGDTIPDLVLATRGDAGLMAPGLVAILRNNGSAGFLADSAHSLIASTPVALAVGDLDGDGRNDVAVVSRDFAVVSVLSNNGKDGLGAEVSYAGIGEAGTGVAIGDIDHNGMNDLVVAASGGVSVLLNKGDGNFTSPFTLIQAAAATGVGLEDFNRDGWLDVAFGYADERGGLIAIVTGGPRLFDPPVVFGRGTANAKGLAISKGGYLVGLIDDGEMGRLSVFQNTTKVSGSSR